MATNGQDSGSSSSPLQDFAYGIGSGIASVVLIFFQSYVAHYFDGDPYYHVVIRIILYIVTTLLFIVTVVYILTAILEKIDDTHSNLVEGRHGRAVLREEIRAMRARGQGQISPPAYPQSGAPVYDADKRHVPYAQNHRAAQRRKVRKVARATFIGSLLIGALGIATTFLKNHFIPPTVTTVVATPTVVTRTFTVVANRDWQDAGVAVPQGDTVTILYLQGVWNAWPDNYPSSDANGPLGTDVDTSCTCNQPVPGYSTQGLVGRVGQGVAFFVGDSKSLRSPTSGELQLRINDDVLTDNTGSVDVSITVQP